MRNGDDDIFCSKEAQSRGRLRFVLELVGLDDSDVDVEAAVFDEMFEIVVLEDICVEAEDDTVDNGTDDVAGIDDVDVLEVDVVVDVENGVA